MSFSLSGPEKEAIKILAMMNTIRGEDSTGAFFGWRKGKKIKYAVQTKVGPAWDFFSEPAVQQKMNTHNLCMIVGHDRAATMGKVNERNAHPIVEGQIIGVHNGTIEKFKPKKEEEDTMSDSRVLFSTINEKGALKALSSVDGGAFATVFMNMNDQTINFARNYQRPLYLMWSKDHRTLLWASEDWMLKIIDRRSPIVWDSPSMLTANKLTSFNFRTMKSLPPVEIEEERAPVPVRTFPSVEDWLNRPRFLDNGRRGNDPGVGPSLPRLPKPERPELDKPTPGMRVTNPPEPKYSAMFAQDEAAIRRQTVKLRISSGLITNVVFFYNIGIIHKYNKFGELVAVEHVRNREKDLITRYMGYERELFSMKRMESVINKGECSLCSSAGDIKDELYWHSSTEWFCSGCVTSGATSGCCHPAQLFKGVIMPGPKEETK